MGEREKGEAKGEDEDSLFSSAVETFFREVKRSERPPRSNFETGSGRRRAESWKPGETSVRTLEVYRAVRTEYCRARNEISEARCKALKRNGSRIERIRCVRKAVGRINIRHE